MKRSPMEAHLQEWLNLVVRLIHVVAAIMWIGDSFLFMFLDKSLETPRSPRQGDVIGEMWMTHGGGFYELVKRKSLTLAEMPPTLHWFKWESYMTWMSGFTLLVVVYYMTGGSYLIDPTVSAITPGRAILLSLGLLVVGWVVYDILCTVLVNYTRLLAAICFCLVVGIGFGLSQVFSQRAAFIHVGALMATCMSGNVFFRIIPGQKKMLEDTLANRPVDTSFGVRAKTRSTHNHYITLPVVLMMLSNHFPSLYGNRHSWVVLAMLFVFGMGVKFIMNFKLQSHPLVFAATIGSFGTIIFLTAPKAIALPAELTSGPKVPYSLAHQIVQNRCVSCHAGQPSNAAFVAAPAGVMLDKPEFVKQYASRILVRAVHTKTMPLGNMTGMTDTERLNLGRWVAQGANLGSLDESIPPELLKEQAGTTTLDPASEAKKIYTERCSTCHGLAGDGNGVAAGSLTPRPRNFKDATWQSAQPDEMIAKVIVQGGPSIGKNALMPANQDLASKPEVVTELTKIIRAFSTPLTGDISAMPSPELCVQGKRVFTQSGLRPASIHISDGKITRVGTLAETPSGVLVLDAQDALVTPGVVDSHVHINEPGRTEWEGFSTATQAAAAGGITTVVDMPLNCIPATTSVVAAAEKLASLEGKLSVNVAFWGGVIPGNASELKGLAKFGVPGAKCFLVPSGVDEFPHVTAKDLDIAMPILRDLGMVLLVHAELPEPIDRATEHLTQMLADPRSYRTYLCSRPNEAEDEAVSMIIDLCEKHGTRTHIVHLASASSVPLLRAAQKRGVPISAETCLHYLAFCAEEIEDGATHYKCAPPIRNKQNREGLWEGLADGTISMVVSDHSPCTPGLKHMDSGDFMGAWGGIAGLQFGLSVLWTLASERGFGLERVIQWNSVAPAKLAGLSDRKGKIAPGYDADLVIWDDRATVEIKEQSVHHRHKVTPYTGKQLKGSVLTTVVNGTVAYDAKNWFSAPAGQFLPIERV